VSRWEPGAEQRLQGAALTLFLEHGYENVTVAQIAQKAGLTRRTFFNHFADKREIFFSGAAAFRASVVEHLDQADPDLPPVQAALAALTAAGRGIAAIREYAPTVRQVIASSSELQERDRSKLASITAALTEGLEDRGVPARAASFAARAVVTAYTTAWEDWVARPDEDFGELMRQALAELRAAIDAG
jgi:AcrR family transcriptional regulator